MRKIEVNKDIHHERKILVSFPYNPEFVSKVKSIVGHKSSKTTEIYTHVSEKDIARLRSPLDTIMEKRCDDVKKKVRDKRNRFGLSPILEG
jgi:hypothetical protein